MLVGSPYYVALWFSGPCEHWPTWYFHICSEMNANLPLLFENQQKFWTEIHLTAALIDRWRSCTFHFVTATVYTWCWWRLEQVTSNRSQVVQQQHQHCQVAFTATSRSQSLVCTVTTPQDDISIRDLFILSKFQLTARNIHIFHYQIVQKYNNNRSCINWKLSPHSSLFSRFLSLSCWVSGASNTDISIVFGTCFHWPLFFTNLMKLERRALLSLKQGKFIRVERGEVGVISLTWRIVSHRWRPAVSELWWWQRSVFFCHLTEKIKI